MRLQAILSAILLGLLVFDAGVLAQGVSGTVKGVVMDSTGAVVPGANCVLTNVATGSSVTVTTFAEGVFTFSNVLPGTYNLKIDAAGFKSSTTTGVVVTAGELRTLGNLSLQVGESTETVQVTAEAAAIQLASAEHSVRRRAARPA